LSYNPSISAAPYGHVPDWSSDIPSTFSPSGARQSRDTPLLLEVGARFGLEPPWAELVAAGTIRACLIEPDPLECERLAEAHPAATVLTTALGEERAERPLHVTRHPGCSSLLVPDAAALAPYEVRKWFEVVRREPVQLKRLDELIADGGIDPPDYVHVDVQGYERQVLVGAGDHLPRTLGIKLELHTTPLYEGEPSLYETGAWLAEEGFRLVGLHQQGPFEGDPVEFNAFFANHRPGLSERERALVELWVRLHGLRSDRARDEDTARVNARLRELEQLTSP
jgi:FkbM family methyltransferase